MKDTEGMEDLIGEIQKGLINWYDFRLNSRILYIGKEDDAYFHLLQNLPLDAINASAELVKNEEWQKKHEDGFDHIIAIRILEILDFPVSLIS